MIIPLEGIAMLYIFASIVVLLPASLFALMIKNTTSMYGDPHAATRARLFRGLPPLSPSTMFTATVFMWGIGFESSLSKYDDCWLIIAVCPFAALLYACLAYDSFRVTPSKSTKQKLQFRVALLLLTVAVYFKVLFDECHPYEWVYLLGLVPAFPIAVLSARMIGANRSIILTAPAVVAAWTTVFWTGPLVQASW